MGSEKKSVDETWKPVWGEVSEIRNHYNQVISSFETKYHQPLAGYCFQGFCRWCWISL